MKDRKDKRLIARLMAISALLLVAGCTGGGEPEIEVHNAKAVLSPQVVNAVSIFMEIENSGEGDDTLVSASIKEHPHARVELHDVVGGKMQKVEEIKLPKGKTVELKSGSLHIMAFNIRQLESEISVVLNFEKSGKMVVTATRGSI